MKKTASIQIIFLLSALIAVFATSCSNENNEITDNITTSSTDMTVTETVVSETEMLFHPALPETDFDGREFRILCWSRDTDPLITDFCVDEESGDPVLDAVFRRNLAVEEEYNVKILFEEKGRDSILNTATRAILANEDNWDIIDSCINDLYSYANKSYLTELSSLEYLDLSSPWWDARFVDDMSINNKLYMILGDINIFDDSCTWSFFYNKVVADSLGITNLYEKAYDGTWTLDILYDYAKSGAADLNGDGIIDENDRFGMLTERANLYFHFLGTGERVAKKGTDGLPELTMYTERGASALDKIFTMMKDGNCSSINEDRTSGQSNLQLFRTNAALFHFGAVGGGYSHLRSMTDAFGILPVPKLDESQTEYYNGVSQFWGTALGIPVTDNDPAFAAYMLEAMSAASVSTVTKAFNEIVFNSKGLRDEESIGMLELIAHSRVYDIGYLNNWGSVQSVMNNLMTKDTLQFSSEYAKLEPKMLKDLEKSISLYKEQMG